MNTVASNDGMLDRIERCLLSGCDERISLRPDAKRNQYHLHPMRFERLFMRGSCTCCTLTAAGLESARAFINQYTPSRDQEWVQRHVQRLRQMFDPRGIAPFDVFFGPSGSDMVYWPLIIQAVLHPGKTIVNMVSCPEELGAGSVAAAAGKYFSHTNQFGAPIPKGSEVASRIPMVVRYLAAREDSGRIADRRQAIRDLVSAYPDNPLIGNLVFGSKSGIEDDLTIIDEFPERVLWVVDMCQFRAHTELINELLCKRAVVMVTGSKFFQAPPFCGALLVPLNISRSLEKCEMQHIAPYGAIFSAQDAPAALAGFHDVWPTAINSGLRLRWQIAIDEMEAYHALPRNVTDAFIRRWNRVVTGKLAQGDRFGLMPDMELTNDSIISMTVSAAGRQLQHDELKLLFDTVVTRTHEGLGDFDHAFIGQPVRYGARSFIRLAIGSHDVRQQVAAGTFDIGNDLRLIEIIERTAEELFES